ncbi:MAG TPA: hypothetical protein VE028_01030 [Nitratidesulfovibrio sp.]|nr:hypothetical protein [Nitratidesulfovibrio sp.]
MALLNFLYKDEPFIASLYAQTFRGRLVQVAQGNNSTTRNGLSVNASVKVLSGGTTSDATFTESRSEIIDPHDAAALDVLNHLDSFVVQEGECKRGDIIKISGGLFVVSYEHREALLDHAFEGNKQMFDQSLAASVKDKKQRSKLIELSKKGCIGSKEEVRFFLKSSSQKWYWGSLIKGNITGHLPILQMTCGAREIPVSVIALYLGEGQDAADENSAVGSLAFITSLQWMTGFVNTLFVQGAGAPAGLAPIAIVMPINANAEGEG